MIELLFYNYKVYVIFNRFCGIVVGELYCFKYFIDFNELF